MDSGLILGSLIHFDLIFVHDVTQWSELFFPFNILHVADCLSKQYFVMTVKLKI